MSDDTSLPIRMPPDYSDFIASVQALAIPNLVFQTLPLQSVADYSLTQHENNFPRPSEYFVIADYLIDLPIIAVDLGPASSSYGQVLGYAYGDFWLIADSLVDFAERLKAHHEDAVWGK